MSRERWHPLPAKAFAGLDLLSRWKPYREGMCNGCLSYCCHLPVEASASDMVRLGFAEQDEYRDSPRKLFRKLSAQKIVSAFRQKTGLFTLAQKPDGSCIFLGADRRCTVYEKRPEVCRKFPSVGPRPGFCPERKMK
ncbi:MAG: hypothetical protein RIQ81_1687 [Pseudomonadota bacterium]|jgi:Fe-S-cluster containining protein